MCQFFLRLYMIYFKYGLILLQSYSTGSGLFLSSFTFILNCYSKKLLNCYSKNYFELPYQLFPFSVFFQSKEISYNFNYVFFIKPCTFHHYMLRKKIIFLFQKKSIIFLKNRFKILVILSNTKIL